MYKYKYRISYIFVNDCAKPNKKIIFDLNKYIFCGNYCRGLIDYGCL